MGGVMKNSKRLIRNHQGQSIMEYVIISSLVGILCLVAVKGLGEVLDKRINHIKSKIVQYVEI